MGTVSRQLHGLLRMRAAYYPGQRMWYGQQPWERFSQAPSSSSGFASAVESGTNDEPSPSSWFQKLKGVFTGKTSPGGSAQVAQESATVSQQDLTMENFADELKKARQFGSLTTFGRGLPRGGEMSAVKSLERQEGILRALARRDPVRVAGQHKAEVAAECGCTVRDVEDVVAKYEWAKEANRRVMKLKEEGKPLPKSLDEVEAMMGGRWSAAASVNLAKTGQLSRNAACPCGSGKKYKRCCGKSET
ncbi:unnamed protein product [Sphagnum compactum]